MKTFAQRTADPVADTVLVRFDGPPLAAHANPAVWALAVRWGSRMDNELDTCVAAALRRGASPLGVPVRSES